MARIIDGKLISRRIKDEVKNGVQEYISKTGCTPQLDVILVGEDPASLVYVKNKQTACEKAGIRTYTHRLPADIGEDELISIVSALNSDLSVNGILLQLPLPAHINAERVLETIAPSKDVDGLTSANSGLLYNGKARLMPCTPAGCLEMIRSTGINTDGARAVILGRSKLVGLPLFHMLTRENCTVTVCHSHTKDITSHTLDADILVAAVGKPLAVTADMVKPGCVVIDVGINRLPDGTLCGDVDFEAVKEKAGWITPVPGGAGPMTIAMLLRNTLTAAEDQNG